MHINIGTWLLCVCQLLCMLYIQKTLLRFFFPNDFHSTQALMSLKPKRFFLIEANSLSKNWKREKKKRQSLSPNVIGKLALNSMKNCYFHVKGKNSIGKKTHWINGHSISFGFFLLYHTYWWIPDRNLIVKMPKTLIS